nr:MauE/DoxX family redox-associated membrane protein [Chitinophaga parva]
MKIIDHAAFVSNLADSPWHLIAGERIWFSWALPIGELITTIALIIPKFRLIGFSISTLLFASFTTYLSYFILSKIHLPCSCGGIIGYLNWHQHLLLNIVLLLVSVWGTLVEIKLHRQYESGDNLTYTT